jgi:hypothetical protein
VICDDRRREETGELEPAVAVRCAHHGNLDTLIAQSSDTSGPFSFDRGLPFELEAEFAKESIVPPRSSTTIPTLSIRLSAMFPISKVSFQYTRCRRSNNGRLRCPQHRRPFGPDFAAVQIRSLNHGPVGRKKAGVPFGVDRSRANRSF